MKKFTSKLSYLSLIQQLSLIVFIFGFVLVTFFSVYLRNNINKFISDQVMTILRTSQSTIVEKIQSGSPGTSELGADYEVMTFAFYRDGTMIGSWSVPVYTNEFLQNVTEMALAEEQELSEGLRTVYDGNYYYRTNWIDKNRVVISLMSDSYAKSIEDSLISGVSNTSAVIISGLFILMTVWSVSIVTPLQQIRRYIDQVRKGEEATLNIDRKDEIGELANELVSLQEELKYQEKTKEEMVHNISHDLKTPIATIKSYAESIKDGIYPYDTLEKSVDVIIDNANRLEQKVHSLLFLNRLDYMMDQARDTDKTCDMKETVESVLLNLKMIRPEVSIDCDLEPVTFKGDEESWRVVVENILDNALRYAQSLITIELKDRELLISNDGPAISEDRMLKLFKPFEKGTKGKFGLGLSICHKVCQAYGYSIDAENQETMVVFRIADKNKTQDKKKRSRQ